jgi:hypothetical protein
MKDKCPHCNKINCVEQVVFSNCEAYKFLGLSGYDLPCKYCGGIISVTMLKSVKVYCVEKSDKTRDECDW